MHCGAPLSPGVKFCIYCGEQLVRDLSNSTPADLELPKETTQENVNVVEETKPTPITQTETSEPSPKPQGNFWEKTKHLFRYPDPFIFGIAGLVTTILFMILVGANGFPWWMVFFLLLPLVCTFEIVLSILQTPTTDGSKNFFKRFPKWIGIGLEKKKMIFKIIAAALCATAVLTFLGSFTSSLFVGFANYAVITNHTYEAQATDFQVAPLYGATDGYERFTFLPGHRFEFVSNYQSTQAGYGTNEYTVTGRYTRTSTLLTLKLDKESNDVNTLCGIVTPYGTATMFGGFTVTIKNGKAIVAGTATFNRV